MSWLEGIFSRGDRRLTGALINAWRMGARFDAWSEHYKMGVWIDALKKSGLDPAFYLYRQRPMDEVFPWDHIDTGVSRRWLWLDWQAAQRAEVKVDCRHQCVGCGSCQPDSGHIELKSGDLLVHTTDGLNEEVSAETIASLLTSPDDIETRAKSLIQAALDAGGKDNITIAMAEL